MAGLIKDISQFNEDFIEKYIEGSDEGYFLKVDVQYVKKVHEVHNDLPFLSERMKTEKVEKLVANYKWYKWNNIYNNRYKTLCPSCNFINSR